MQRGPPLPPIAGRIVHRVQLAAPCKTTSQKRPRSLETQWPDDKPPKAVQENTRIVPWAGWVLEQDSDDDGRSCYLLSMPQRLWRTVDAAGRCTVVSVDRYASLPLSSGLTLLEVHAWHVLGVNADPQPQHTLSGDGDRKPQDDDDDDVWSLRALARREAVDRILPLQQPPSNYYSFCGRVHTLSPVLTMDPKDPFCLLELRDNHDDDSLEIMSRSNAVLCW